MRLYYPRSFLKLLFVGFALVALPLMFALINNAISIDALGNQSQKAVYQAVQATQSSRKLAETITAMERVAHQMLILGERSLLNTYRVHRKQLLATAQEFASLPFDSEQRTALREIVMQEEAHLRTALESGVATGTIAEGRPVVRCLGRARAVDQPAKQRADRP